MPVTKSLLLTRHQAAVGKRLLSLGKTEHGWFLPEDVFCPRRERDLLEAVRDLCDLDLIERGRIVNGQVSVRLTRRLVEELLNRGQMGLACVWCGAVVGDLDVDCSQCGHEQPPL